MGEVKKQIIYKITKEYTEIYGLSDTYIGRDIVVYNTRETHLKKHKNEFSDIEAFNTAYMNIDKIIKNPDFISTGNDDDSLLFIKQFSDQCLVAARITATNDFKIRTLYPINNNKKDKLMDSSITDKPNIGKKTTTK